MSTKKGEKDNDVKSKKHFVSRDSMDQIKQEVEAKEESMDKQKDVEEKINKEIAIIEGASPKLKKIVQVLEIQGEFTTYKPVGHNSFDIKVDGQIITLSREQMQEFGEELLAVVAEKN